jgi:enoyl reductase-like protein
MLPVLNAQQLRILHAVQALYETHPGRGCSVREVLLAAGMRDVGTTHDTIRELAEMGFLTHVPGKPNTIVPRFRR